MKNFILTFVALILLTSCTSPKFSFFNTSDNDEPVNPLPRREYVERS